MVRGLHTDDEKGDHDQGDECLASQIFEAATEEGQDLRRTSGLITLSSLNDQA